MAPEADAEVGLLSDRDEPEEDIEDETWPLHPPPAGGQDHRDRASPPGLRALMPRPGAAALACTAVAAVGAGAWLLASVVGRTGGPLEVRSFHRGGRSPQVKALWGWFGTGGGGGEQKEEAQEGEGYYGGAPMLHDTDQFVDTPTDVQDPAGYDADALEGGAASSAARARSGATGADASYDYSWGPDDPYAIRSDPAEVAALHQGERPAAANGGGDTRTASGSPEAAVPGAAALAVGNGGVAGGGAAGYPVANTDAAEEAALHRADVAAAALPSPTSTTEPGSPVDAGLLHPLGEDGVASDHDSEERPGSGEEHVDFAGPGEELRAGETFTKTTTSIMSDSHGETTSIEHTIAVTPTTLPTPVLEGSLFCFAVMMSTGYELPLMQEQFSRGAGIFGCDRFAVLSDAEVALNTDPLASVVTENIGNLHCNYGGPYDLALNSEVFTRAWQRVFADGFYRYAAWSVKADPDAVFLPGRLRKLVQGADPNAKAYLNNCDEGLHGPVEVLALGAMKAFDANVSDCITVLKSEFSWSGEDVFLRHCLGYLKVDRVDSFTLLKEDHCFHKNPARDGCYTGEVAFHPFKNNAGWFKCLAQAEDEQQDMTTVREQK